MYKKLMFIALLGVLPCCNQIEEEIVETVIKDEVQTVEDVLDVAKPVDTAIKKA